MRQKQSTLLIPARKRVLLPKSQKDSGLQAIRDAWGKFEDPGRKTGSDDDAAIRRIITDKDFEALDALASKFRTEKARYASGMWR
ncbi:MAG: hypothetical protein ABIP20_16860, partial [Chthoniobacteraceae bacterium]